MSTITTRAGKGSPLTTTELDSNFTNLNTDKIENVVEDTTPQLGGDLSTNGNDINFGDNDKAIFGAGSDLQIYHNGTNSYIDDTGTGNLYIRAATSLVLAGGTTGEKLLQGDENGALTLYYDGISKLSTTSTGIDVTGTATMDGLTVDGNATLGSGGSGAANVAFVLNGSDAGTHGTVIQGKRNGTSQYILGDIAGIVGSGNGMASWVYSSNPYYVYTGNTKSLEVAGNGDISFYEDTGTTAKFFWDASAESLELGNSSGMTPTASLVINEAVGGTPAIEIVPTVDDSNNTTAAIRLWGTRFGTANRYSEIRNVTDGATAYNELAFDTNGTERLRIGTSGNVGIGTSSPADALHISNSSATDIGIRLDRNSSERANLQAVFDGAWLNGAQVVRLATGDTERMRIDSSGNLLVGKTSTGLGVAGAQIGGNGQHYFTTSGDAPIKLNRLTDDGQIIQLRKDGTVVGSLGIQSSGFYIDGETSHAGLRFGGHIVPRYNGSDDDAQVDLGESGIRFKDLYLSGGVYLGGTGAANKLEDYEEGIIDASAFKIGGVAITDLSGVSSRYTKVGRMVHVQIRVTDSACSATTDGAFTVDLPFAATQSGSSGINPVAIYMGGASQDTSGSSLLYPADMTAYIQNTTTIKLIRDFNVNSGELDVDASSITACYMWFEFSYIAA